jgi:hypothetical protein
MTGWYPRGMFQRLLIPALATALSLVLLLAGIASPFLLISLLGPPPCQDESWVYDVTRLAVPLSLIVSSIWLYRIRHRVPSLTFLFALALPVCAIGLNALAARSEVSRQAACARRGLQEAMVGCGADRSHYRQGVEGYGYKTLTLIAPGSTDDAWSCLWTWAIYNGSVSLKVDESVYEHYRRAHARP